MLSQIYFNFCVNAWSWLAQATPVATRAAQKAGAATPAATAPPAPAMPPPMAPPSAVPSVPVEATSMPGMEQVPIQAGHSMVYNLGHSLVLFMYFMICIGLIMCVMFQTTKAEGLSGVIGGQVSSPLTSRKKSADELLSLWTSRLAVAFIVSSLLIWFVFGRHA